MNDHDAPDVPMLRIVRGSPDDVEIAALAAATASLTAPSEPTEPPSVWADRATALRYPGGRRPLRHGPGAWRASGLPG